MREILLALTLAGCAIPSSQAAGPVYFSLTSTVKDFGSHCGKASFIKQRDIALSACHAYLTASVAQIAAAKKSPECWDQLTAGKASPLALLAALQDIATDPEAALQPLDWHVRLLVGMSAPDCK